MIRAVAETAAHFGGLDILINNAGHHAESVLRDTTAADVDLHFAVDSGTRSWPHARP